jgi:hypothetical protein
MNYDGKPYYTNEKPARAINSHRSRILENEQSRMIRSYMQDLPEPSESKHHPQKMGFRLIINALLNLVRL